ncbi:hypothetical protein BDW02DRAFT_532550 [Decorospora gaudefroyi]|uniref:FAD-binding PCMH-type domain-containing protein n=1 Tax=Decorospora gaudefroyi TaxID=184978 RepID=A0A6A5K274_9PLEO|nr:hypothetical protein BDW02DRAFT_532550 [Decorospora gaudefroyi]
MTTLSRLKQALVERVKTTAPTRPTQPLSESQYAAGFNVLTQSPAPSSYQHFIVPELSYLLAPLHTCSSDTIISVLEIGPGPRSIFGLLPASLRERIGRYTAYEPNTKFAARLEQWFEQETPLPDLHSEPDIRECAFNLDGGVDEEEKFDIVLFCHSMYGMTPKQDFLRKTLKMLVDDGIVVVFHRANVLHMEGLVCHHTANYPTGLLRVPNDDVILGDFARFVAGFAIRGGDEKATQAAWRNTCRALGRREGRHFVFSVPEVMFVFNQHATSLPRLSALVALGEGNTTVKNGEARLHRSAPVVRPKDIPQIQHCVRWAKMHGVGLTVIGGGHSGHCMVPNVVAVDMSAFNNVHVLPTEDGEGTSTHPLVIVESGCKTVDVIQKTMDVGLTVPLGSRPSVGAGLWLQGGIGHLSRLQGLACDSIVGAVLVSVADSRVLYVGQVPHPYRPAGAVRPENAEELLWAIKGAGTNFGIVVSVTMKAFPAPTYWTKDRVMPLKDDEEAWRQFENFDHVVAGRSARNCSADAYLYADAGQLHLGITTYESCTSATHPDSTIWAPDESPISVDGIGLFGTEMYMSTLHGGHSNHKTSSFKRCIFLKDIYKPSIAKRLTSAISTCPSPLCYLHLLHGGGAIADVRTDATAFGNRDWDFACVITGVWGRDQDGTDVAQATVQWVYDVATNLLPVSNGVYGADLGPDPRDAVLATQAFGQNGDRLARLKQVMDPDNVLAYACPLPKVCVPTPKLIVLVTGESCAGKDFCANIWVSQFLDLKQGGVHACAASISDVTKREYATATGADIDRLLNDRAYKEEHRPSLTTFYNEQVQKRPRLPEEHFLAVVHNAANVDVLFITGMRDAAPVSSFSPLVPESRVLEVHIVADPQTCHLRGGAASETAEKTLEHKPSFLFTNDTIGDEAARRFAETHLFPFLHHDLKRLQDMVRTVPCFPQLDITFRHILGIASQPSGLRLCTSLLQSHFSKPWKNIGAVIACEAGGLVFAPALALHVGVPLVVLREAGKLPPPTISVPRTTSSYISAARPPITVSQQRGGGRSKGKATGLEMESHVLLPMGDKELLVLDDVLSTGETLVAILRLLGQAGVEAGRVSVMVVAEFPAHAGREMLRKSGFGAVGVQSLMVLGGK